MRNFHRGRSRCAIEGLETRRLLSTAAPVIRITGNGNTIAPDDFTPSVTDNTNFGSAALGASAIDKTFVVHNDGNLELDTLPPALPGPEYSIVEGLNSAIAPGGSDAFTIRLSTATAGVFAGNIAVSSNDPVHATFNYAVTATITSAPAKTLKVNFEPAGRPVPSGYLPDTGATFGNRGNGQSYGWNASASSFTRDRNAIPDQAKDTLVHMQLYGNRTWEVALPNGQYKVRLVVGDPSYIDSVYKVSIEGQATIGGTPSKSTHFFDQTVTVNVSDGKLTLNNAAGAKNNKLDFIEITPSASASQSLAVLPKSALTSATHQENDVLS